MQRLPPELHLHIVHYLPVEALCNLCLCSQYYHEISIPELYRDLTIQVQITGLDISVYRKVQAYTENFFKRCEHLQSITVCGSNISESALPFALRPICLFLGAILQTRCSKGLKSFNWKLDCPCGMDFMKCLPSSIEVLELDARLIDYSKHVRNLSELRCHRICSVEQAEWLARHVEQNARGLRRLFFGFESSQSTMQSQVILQSLQRIADSSFGNSLHYVGLDNMDLSRWPSSEMPLIRHLCLMQCHNIEEALSRFVAFNKHCTRLRRLDVTLNQRSTCIREVLGKLQCLTRLTSLQLMFGGESNKFPLEGILLSRRSLRHLFLESRRNVSDPTTVHPYQVQEFLKITESCSSLKTLSIPVKITRDSRMMLVNYSQIVCRCSTDCHLQKTHRSETGLRHLHVRCHRDLSRIGNLRNARVDAMRIGTPFLPRDTARLLVTIGNEARTFSWRMSKDKKNAPILGDHSIGLPDR